MKSSMFFRRKNIFAVVLLFIVIILYPSLFFSEEPKRDVMVITLSGVINPVATEYIGKSIKIANEKKVEVLVIELDTPGGLDTSMRKIVRIATEKKCLLVSKYNPAGAGQ